MTKNNEPAFPTQTTTTRIPDKEHYGDTVISASIDNPGMTLRDYFATHLIDTVKKEREK